MGTKAENDVRREANVAKVEAQLKGWSTQIDDLVASNREAGAQAHDAYVLRIDGLRTRLGVVQAKLTEFTGPSAEGGPWGTFRAGISDDWTALVAGFKDLQHDPPRDGAGRDAEAGAQGPADPVARMGDLT